MAKTKNKLTPLYLGIVSLCVVLIVGVIVVGSHLSDVVAHLFNLPQQSSVASNETHKKVTGELHNHIEKQNLKSITKVMGDDIARTDRRHVKRKGRAKRTHFHLSELLFKHFAFSLN